MATEVSAASASLDAEAFDELIAVHGPTLHAYFARRAAAAADDLYGQLWLTAYETRARYESERGPVRAWLVGIARNLLLAHYWRAARELPPPIYDGLDWVRSTVASTLSPDGPSCAPGWRRCRHMSGS